MMTCATASDTPVPDNHEVSSITERHRNPELTATRNGVLSRLFGWDDIFDAPAEYQDEDL